MNTVSLADKLKTLRSASEGIFDEEYDQIEIAKGFSDIFLQDRFEEFHPWYSQPRNDKKSGEGIPDEAETGDFLLPYRSYAIGALKSDVTNPAIIKEAFTKEYFEYLTKELMEHYRQQPNVKKAIKGTTIPQQLKDIRDRRFWGAEKILPHRKEEYQKDLIKDMSEVVSGAQYAHKRGILNPDNPLTGGLYSGIILAASLIAGAEHADLATQIFTGIAIVTPFARGTGYTIRDVPTSTFKDAQMVQDNIETYLK